jgi:preprotein translocase subunit SecG
MLTLVIGFLTFFIIVDCLVLSLLVLIQLPKKDAGAGLAFGGGATDALFGAGSGNVLTKATKYSAILFFVLAIVLSVLQTHVSRRGSAQFKQELQQQQEAPRAALPPPAATPNNAVPGPEPAPAPATNAGMNLLAPALMPATNTPATPQP